MTTQAEALRRFAHDHGVTEEQILTIADHVAFTRPTPRSTMSTTTDDDQMGEAPEELLTRDEHHVLTLLADLSEGLHDIIQAGEDRAVGMGDWTEAVAHIHALQRMVGAQAAARAFPGRYRLLGAQLAQ